MSEIWRDIPEYPDYRASDQGRLLSFKVSKYGKLMSPYKRTDGYCYVSLIQNGKRKCKKVHRLVISAFEGISELSVDHINQDRSDNRLVNLRYCTMALQQRNRKNRIQPRRVGNRYVLRIKYKGKDYHLGTVSNEKDGVSVMRSVEKFVAYLLDDEKTKKQRTS